MEFHTRDLSPYYRKAVGPQDVQPPFSPAPPLKRETALLEDGRTVLEKDLAIKMRDGVVLFANLYRPSTSIRAKTPTLVLFAPFGKHGAVPRQQFKNMGVDFSKLSKHTYWELPDPFLWCGEWEYSLLSVDPRGTWWSGGGASNHLSPEEGRDGYDVVEWAAQQEWSTGNIGWGGGVSYFAMSAYQTAVLKPPHLKAIMIWEGISDLYREVNMPGGIPNVPFQHFWMNLTGNGHGVTDDHAVNALEHPLFDAYWQSKVVDWSLICAPVMSVTGWSSLGLHLRGTIEAWKQMSSEKKYLLVHGGREWNEFYKDENILKQRLFWDRFLKDVSNEVDKWPRVEFDVRTSVTEGYRRKEANFPPQLQLVEYLFGPEGKAQDSRLADASGLSPQYVSFVAHKQGSGVHFDVSVNERLEVTGHSSVTIYVQALQFPDIDLFASLQKIDKDGNIVKFYHSSQQIEADASFGWLRVSHRELDEAKSTPERPVHLHRKRLWLQPRDIVKADIELWPTSTVWNAGEIIRIAIQGTTFTDAENPTQYKGPSHNFGEVRLWFGGSYKSRLLLPHAVQKDVVDSLDLSRL